MMETRLRAWIVGPCLMLVSCALFERRPIGKILSCYNPSLGDITCPSVTDRNPMAISVYDRPDGSRIAEEIDTGEGIPYVSIGEIIDGWVEIEFLDGTKGYLNDREEFAIQRPMGGNPYSIFDDGRI